jgi:hypothetical protein
MKRKLVSLVTLVLAISASSAIVTPSANAAPSNCTVAICSPNSSGVIDIRRPLYGPFPATICTLVNNWEMNTAVSFVSGVLKIKWFYTWVPSVVCHVVG